MEENEFNVFVEKNGMLYVSFISPKLTGLEWIDKFENKGIRLSPQCKAILKSKRFVPTVNNYKLVIILGSHFGYRERTIANVREFAYSNKLFKVTLEAACILRWLLSDDKAKEMFLRSLVAVSTHAGKEFTRVLGFDVDESPNSLQTYGVKEILRWRRSTGFIFSENKIKH